MQRRSQRLDAGSVRAGRLAGIIGASGLLASLAGAILAVVETRADRETALMLGLMAALCAGALWLARRRMYVAANRALFLIGAGGTTALVLSGRTVGFGDIAVMLYPVLVIAASLLLGRRDSALGLGLVLLLLGLVLMASLRGWIEVTATAPALIADFGFAVLIVVVSGVASRLMAAGLERSQREVRRNEAALERANRRLEAEAARRESLIQQLQARNDELQSFTYTVSHDLKSPLVTIGGFVGCLERDLRSGDHERLRRDLGRIKLAQERMSEILKDLLELSRAGQLADPTERVEFSEVVAEAADLTEGIRVEAGVRLVVSDPLPVVTGDRRRLIQVMQNLIENAARFSGDAADPTVEIGARRLDGETMFWVRDRGIGVDPLHHERIFDLFRKLEPESAGSGVGLALVRRIVEVHGGRVWVESAGRGEGSEFRFTLPDGPNR